MISNKNNINFYRVTAIESIYRTKFNMQRQPNQSFQQKKKKEEEKKPVVDVYEKGTKSFSDIYEEEKKRYGKR